jgi:hypothetical protein
MWKLPLSVLLLVGGWVGMVIALTSFGGNEDGSTIAIVCLVVGVSGLLFAFVSVKCPKCNYRWVWVAASKKNKSEWPYWFLKLNNCPRCGYDGSEAT